jgi:hypothetical protein
MSLKKTPRQTITHKGPLKLPDEISPAIYLKQFVDWLESSPIGGQGKAIHVVHLRMAWLSAPAPDAAGVVAFGEIGTMEGDAATMRLETEANSKRYLKGAATLFRSDKRGWIHPDAPATDGGPFDHKHKEEVEVAIDLDTGQISLHFKSDAKNWTILPKYAIASNFLSGTPTISPPLPVVMLSLASLKAFPM